MQIVDSSVCLPAVNGAICTEEYIGYMQAFGITRSVLAAGDQFLAVKNNEGNEQIIRLVNSDPEKFAGLAVVNPWHGDNGVAMLREAFQNGLSGLYINPARQGFRLTEHIIDPLIRVCAEWNRPVLAYTGTPVCSEPFQLAELARRHGDVIFIMGHSAWSDFAGYDVIPAAKQAPNVLIETSCVAGGLIAAFISELGPERVLFGSGYPRSHPRVEVGKMGRLELESDVLKKVLFENAMKLWWSR